MYVWEVALWKLMVANLMVDPKEGNNTWLFLKTHGGTPIFGPKIDSYEYHIETHC